jgi:hypothetical protein
MVGLTAATIIESSKETNNKNHHMEQKYIQTAIDYKKNIAGHFVLVEGAKLKQRVEGERICVTRKIDGHLRLRQQEGARHV